MKFAGVCFRIEFGKSFASGRIGSPDQQSETVNLKPIIHESLEDYVLPIQSDHGVSYWARVLENGLRLSRFTEANVTVISLFALFHHSRRINEWADSDHGLRDSDFESSRRASVSSLMAASMLPLLRQATPRL